MERPWEWRKGLGGIFPSRDRESFHAYDINDNAACDPSIGLIATNEEPNESSPLCPLCKLVVIANPAGNPKKVYLRSE